MGIVSAVALILMLALIIAASMHREPGASVLSPVGGTSSVAAVPVQVDTGTATSAADESADAPAVTGSVRGALGLLAGWCGILLVLLARRRSHRQGLLRAVARTMPTASCRRRGPFPHAALTLAQLGLSRT